MKKILQLTKAIILTLAAVIMLLNTNVLTAQAGVMMFPDSMCKREDGRIEMTNGYGYFTTDNTGREWHFIDSGYPFCVYEEECEEEFRGMIVTSRTTYLDCYLTDIIRTRDESEWPSFVVKGSDGIPFYYSIWGTAAINTYVKHCYDKESGWWFVDDKAKTYRTWECSSPSGLAQDIREAIENGEIINGTAEEPNTNTLMDKVVDSDDAPIHSNDGKTITYPDGRVKYIDDDHYDHYDYHIVYPDGRVEYYCGRGSDEKIIRIEYPDGTVEIEDPYADINTLGATVTLKTDCIKVKKNNAAQKPLPKSVKVGNKALKRNKTYTVSYEKYKDDWYRESVNAITDEGIYRIVITGKNGYEGVCTKTLYVTADKDIKAMSSVSVKVNKMAYTGEPITSGVIKTAKIGKRALTAETDYTVTYTNNTDSGTAQVTLKAKEGSGLLGTKTVNFTITGNKMSKVKVAGISSITYSPDTDLTQNMSNVKLTYNGTTLNKDTDFTVSYLNNTKAGTAKIVFTGKGLYNGTLTKKFKITKATLNDSMLDEASKNIEVTYTGKALKPDVTLKNGDTTLKKDTDYTLTYKNNKKVSTDTAPAQIIVKGKGSYTGSFKVNFAVIAKSNGDDEKSNAKNIKPDAEDPTEEKPVTDEPTEDELVTDEPTEDEPATDEPTEDEPATDEPTEDEPTGDEPATDEPTEEDPVRDEPTGDEPVIDEPTEDEPVIDEPTEEDPATEEPTGDEPVTDEPTGEEPVTDEPTGVDPVIDEPTEEEPVTDEPIEDEPVTDESTVNLTITDEYIIFYIDTETASTVETTAQ